jgi:hypothetical protein
LLREQTQKSPETPKKGALCVPQLARGPARAEN